MKERVFDIIVIGGGASGMMASITGARNGASVLILEHIDMLGKKILATGNGRCNFTNIQQGPEFYRSNSPAFVLPSLEVFHANDTIEFFQELGVMITERNGYCYPRTMQASLIRSALINELDRLHVKVLTDIGIRKISKENFRFCIDSKTGNFYGKRLILATGGKAEPKSGSDGSGYIYAKQLGHSITETVPALVPLISDAKWLKESKGVRQDAKVSVYIEDTFVFADHGEVQFTDYGISGIPVFQISRFAAKALSAGKKVKVSIDFVPEFDQTSLKQWLFDRIAFVKKDKTVKELVDGIVNQKLADILCNMIPFSNKGFHELSKKQFEKMIKETVSVLKNTEITIIGTKPFANAQVTAGGVSVSLVDAKTMESKIVPGLFFAGEILDVDGMCGGYNLQWAWASGYMAGYNAAKDKNR